MSDPAFEYQRQREQERIAWNKANRTAIKSLRAKLLSIGVHRISPQPHPYVRFIDKHGGSMNFPVRVKLMKPNCCQENVMWLWETRTPKGRLKGIATGYALAKDGMWRPHFWALSKARGVASIIETTVEQAQYFGIPIRWANTE